MQEDKVHLFTGVETLRSCVRVMTIALKGAQWNVENMAAALRGDFSNATDLADDLAAKGVSFREAHEIVGQIVQHCLKRRVALEDLKASDLRAFHKSFDEKSVAKLSHRAVLNARISEGGTAPTSVLAQIEKARRKLGQ